MVCSEPSNSQVLTETSHDVIVVGAGIGGVYANHRFRQQELSVLGLEGGGGVGGVWYHNRYPGARVDVESLEYCYFFSPEIYKEWKWSERYAAQPELLAYINFVADKFDVKRHVLFNTWVTSAQWRDGT
jgi:cation diffusion facilitator CzcD-associated flavoprotein CzcO